MKLVYDLGPNDCTAPSYKDNDPRQVFAKALERCGEPATVLVPKPACAACAAWYEERRRDPNAVMNILAAARRAADN